MASDNRYPETTRPSLEEATGLALFGLTSIRAGLNDEWARPERIMEVFPDFNSRNAQEYRVYLGLNALRDESRNLMLTLHTAIERRRLKRSVDPSSHIMTLDPESDLLLFSDHESTLRTKRPHITITSHEEGPEWWGRITTPTRDLRQYVIEYGVTRRAIAPGIAASWLLLTSQRNVPGIPAPLRRAIHERTNETVLAVYVDYRRGTERTVMLPQRVNSSTNPEKRPPSGSAYAWGPDKAPIMADKITSAALHLGNVATELYRLSEASQL